MPAGVWPGRKSKDSKHWGLIGTMATGKRMRPFKGGAAATPHLCLLVAAGAEEPGTPRYDLSTGARNWYLNVKSDFQ